MTETLSGTIGDRHHVTHRIDPSKREIRSTWSPEVPQDMTPAMLDDYAPMHDDMLLLLRRIGFYATAAQWTMTTDETDGDYSITVAVWPATFKSLEKA